MLPQYPSCFVTLYDGAQFLKGFQSLLLSCRLLCDEWWMGHFGLVWTMWLLEKWVFEFCHESLAIWWCLGSLSCLWRLFTLGCHRFHSGLRRCLMVLNWRDTDTSSKWLLFLSSHGLINRFLGNGRLHKRGTPRNRRCIEALLSQHRLQNLLSLCRCLLNYCCFYLRVSSLKRCLLEWIWVFGGSHCRHKI